MWHVQIPVMEKVLRTVLVYGALAVLLRLGGKRDLAQLNSFDLVVMLLLSNVVQNAVIGSDNSLSGGLIGAAVLILINATIVRLVNRYPWAVRIFEGSPTELVRDGHLVTRSLRRLGLRRSDVVAACRRQGADKISEIKDATLTPGGTIVVELSDGARDLTVDALRAENARLLEQIRTEVDAAVARNCTDGRKE